MIRSDVLHPGRANVSKDELRDKLATLYKAGKDAVSVFGFRTQYGGGKSTGFALIYENEEAMKKFEPRYRLVRYGLATKVEKASRQQRMSISILLSYHFGIVRCQSCLTVDINWRIQFADPFTGKQRKNRSKELRGTAKVKGAKKSKKDK